MLKIKRILIGLFALALLGLPAGPHSAAAQTGTRTYEVTVTNITNSKQGLSPLVIATHPSGAHAWQMLSTSCGSQSTEITQSINRHPRPHYNPVGLTPKFSCERFY